MHGASPPSDARASTLRLCFGSSPAERIAPLLNRLFAAGTDRFSRGERTFVLARSRGEGLDAAVDAATADVCLILAEAAHRPLPRGSTRSGNRLHGRCAPSRAGRRAACGRAVGRWRAGGLVRRAGKIHRAVPSRLHERHPGVDRPRRQHRCARHKDALVRGADASLLSGDRTDRSRPRAAWIASVHQRIEGRRCARVPLRGYPRLRHATSRRRGPGGGIGSEEPGRADLRKRHGDRAGRRRKPRLRRPCRRHHRPARRPHRRPPASPHRWPSSLPRTSPGWVRSRCSPAASMRCR